MLIDVNYRTLSEIPKKLLKPIVDACKKAQWTDGNYDRFEKPLADGKLIEFPFPIAKREQNYTEEQRAILQACRPLLEWILSQPQFANYKWIRGEVATLVPGVELGWHRDPQWFHDRCVRLHVPIITNKRCVQLWENVEFHMAFGHLYELNNRVRHSARNAGRQSRTHLILDLMPELEWQQSREQGINPVALVDAPGEY
jgi:hypothetical protein